MVKIFIEGKNKRVPESDFIRALLSHLDVDAQRYEIIHTDGYTNLFNPSINTNIETMRANSDVGGVNLVIFDADTLLNNGGFSKRRAELLDQESINGVTFDLFLWPDNRSDGDVEMLMEGIARKDLYPEFFDCFSKYEHCMSQRKDERGNPFYSTPNRKGKLHTYFHSLPISKTKKDKFGHGEWRWGDNDIWDLDSVVLAPIKEFLSNYFE